MSASERFLILTREASPATRRLRDILTPLGKVEVIPDSPVESGIWYPDDEVAGFGGMCSFPGFTSWGRAMYHLSKTLETNEAVWFVEEDVAGNAAHFRTLVSETFASARDLSAMEIRAKQDDPYWYHWERAEPWFDRPWRAFQPLCRVSARLIRAALDFREKQGSFIFHEVLFSTLAIRHGMSCLDWRLEPNFRRIFGTFQFRPEVEAVMPGVSHPVKDLKFHEAICDLDMELGPIDPASDEEGEFPRLSQAKLDGWGAISKDDYIFLSRYCRTNGIGNIIEFGSGDSTLALLDAGCRVFSLESDRALYEENRRRFVGLLGVNLVYYRDGTTLEREKTPFVPDMVFVDGRQFRSGPRVARLQLCEWALELCGCFILLDAKRVAEQAILAEMKRRGMQVERIRTQKGLAIVVDPQRRPEMLGLSCSIE